MSEQGYNQATGRGLLAKLPSYAQTFLQEIKVSSAARFCAAFNLGKLTAVFLFVWQVKLLRSEIKI